MKNIVYAFLLVVLMVLLPIQVHAENPPHINLPHDWAISEVTKGLVVPQVIVFDNKNRMLIAEEGNASSEAKISRIENNGSKTVLVHGAAFGNELPVTALAFYDGQIYVAHGGTVSIIQSGNRLKDIITGLGEKGRQLSMVFKDGLLYIGVGMKNVYNSCGTIITDPATIANDNPNTGIIVRANPDGSNAQTVVAGLSNIYGLKRGPEDNVYVNEGTCFGEIQANGQWRLIASFSAPIPHLFSFAPANDWGKSTDVFVASGKNILKLNTLNGTITHFASGFTHPSDVEFGPDSALYVADSNGQGVIWRISKIHNVVLSSKTLWYRTFLFILLTIITFLILHGNSNRKPVSNGVIAGIVAGLFMGGVSSLIAILLHWSWYIPLRLLATMVLGRQAMANSLDFDLSLTIIGLVILLLITGMAGAVFAWFTKTEYIRRMLVGGLLFGITFWLLWQYLLWPTLFPSMLDKTFAPLWWAFLFAFYGLVLGTLLAHREYWLAGKKRGRKKKHQFGFFTVT